MASTSTGIDVSSSSASPPLSWDSFPIDSSGTSTKAAVAPDWEDFPKEEPRENKSMLGNVWEWANRPLTESLFGLPTSRKGAGPIERGVEEFASGFTSPLSLGLIFATGGAAGLAEGAAGEVIVDAGFQPEVAETVARSADVVSRMMHIGFTGQMIYSTAKAVPQIEEAIKAGDKDTAIQLGTEAVLSGLSATALGVGAARRFAEPLGGRVTPFEDAMDAVRQHQMRMQAQAAPKLPEKQFVYVAVNKLMMGDIAIKGLKPGQGEPGIFFADSPQAAIANAMRTLPGDPRDLRILALPAKDVVEETPQRIGEAAVRAKQTGLILSVGTHDPGRLTEIDVNGRPMPGVIPGHVGDLITNPDEHPTVSVLKDKWGVTTDPAALIRSGAAFLHSDGSVTYTGAIEHPSAISSAQGNGPFRMMGTIDRSEFINETGSIRSRYNPVARMGLQLLFTVPDNGVSEAQTRMMREAVGKMGREGNLLIQTANGATEVAHGPGLSSTMVDELLKKLGVHPDQDNVMINEGMSAANKDAANVAVKSLVAKITKPAATYAESVKQNAGNRWIRTGAGHPNETLMCQIGTDLINGVSQQHVSFLSKLIDAIKPGPDTLARKYYDSLYSGLRDGYDRMQDFWEIPQWVGVGAKLFPDADVYVIRNLAEAKDFLNAAGYKRVLFSALDVNKNMIKEITQNCPSVHFDVGGYVDPNFFFEQSSHVKWHSDMQSLARDAGVPYVEGVDYRHFGGSDVIPRLTMSSGCLHKCAFCTIEKQIVQTSPESINSQVDAIANLGSKLVYLNDKTFGQAGNYKQLGELGDKIRAKNPNFQGFIIQTTAAQMGKMPEEWLEKSGIQYIEVGIESYNDPILKAMHKPATEHLIDESINKIRRINEKNPGQIALIPNIMIGLPGETPETYAHTLHFLDENRDIISHANIYNLALYKDSGLGKTITTASPGDFNENVLEKSFDPNPGVTRKFAGDLYGNAKKALLQPLEKKKGINPPFELAMRAQQDTSKNFATQSAKSLRETGGSSVNPITNRVPPQGLGLGVVNILPENNLKLDHIANHADFREFFRVNEEVFQAHPLFYIGSEAFKDGTSQLEISAHGTMEGVRTIGQKLFQKGIWDVDNQRVEKLGGSGDVQEFPNYSLDQRLQDLQVGSDIGRTVSVRYPTGLKATEHPWNHVLQLGLNEVFETPGLAEKLANKVQNYVGFKVPDGATAPETLDAFVRYITDNIKWLYDKTTPEERAVSGQWYSVGARGMIEGLADNYGIDQKQAAGVMAVLSPQKDWDMNVSLANRVIDIYKTKQDVKMTSQMIEAANRIATVEGNEGFIRYASRLKGKTLGEVSGFDKAVWIRLYDEATNPGEYQSWNADGSSKGFAKTIGNEKAIVSWGNLKTIGRAVAILDDGSKDNISFQLGKGHKVRSFYNNIIEPMSPRGDVTVDTHSVAAGLMRPVSAYDVEVKHNFSGPGSSQTGVKGTYPLFADAYRTAAKELDIVYPNMLQSIVWNKVRNLFSAEFKTPEVKSFIDGIWREYTDGKITADQARQGIFDEAERHSVAMAARESPAVNQGELFGRGVLGESAEGIERGGRGRIAGETAKRVREPGEEGPEEENLKMFAANADRVAQAARSPKLGTEKALTREDLDSIARTTFGKPYTDLEHTKQRVVEDTLRPEEFMKIFPGRPLSPPNVEADYGVPVTSIIAHEFAHEYVDKVIGFAPDEIWSHNHPALGFGIAEARFMHPPITKENASRIMAKAAKAIYAGIVAQEKIDGIPLRKNPSGWGDLEMLDDICKRYGLSKKETTALHEVGEAGAREILTDEVIDEIKKAAAIREEGIGPELHASKARVLDVIKQIENRIGGNRGKENVVPEGSIGRANGDIRQNVARRAGGVPEGNREGYAGGTSAAKEVIAAAGAAALGGAGASVAEREAEPKPPMEAIREVSPVSGKSKDVITTIHEAAKHYGLSPALLGAQAYQESKLDPNATSGQDAVGIMQLRKKIADTEGIIDRRDSMQNIYAGASYMAKMFSQFKTPEKALAAYNWGSHNLAEAIREHGKDWFEFVPDQTKAYVHGVLYQGGGWQKSAEFKPTPANVKVFRSWGPTGPKTFPGMLHSGDIDLTNRPLVHRPDGGVSTLYSGSFETRIAGHTVEVLVPLISDDGRVLSMSEAKKEYKKTGKSLGIFKTPEQADAYSQFLHSHQGAFQTWKHGGKYQAPVETWSTK